MLTKWLGTATAGVMLIAAAVVFLSGLRQREQRLVLMGSSVLLVLLSAVVLWGLWMMPAPTPHVDSTANGPSVSAQDAEAAFRASQIALPTDTPEQIVRKMGCAVCHKIPTIPHATVGTTGPLLILKTMAPRRLASPEYQARVRAGFAHAKTPKEYVIESIINPGAFIVPGYEPSTHPNVVPMYPYYHDRFSPETLDFLASFLLMIDEDEARREGLLQPAAVPAQSPRDR